MTQETNCPACGAPLVYSGNPEVIRCTFCGADIKISEEDGHAHFQVLAQPEPQKEVLDQPVDRAGPQLGDAQVTQAIPPATQSYPDTPLLSQPVSSGAAVYPVNDQQVTKRSVNRWVWVAIAILVGLLVMCACTALVAAAVISRRVVY